MAEQKHFPPWVQNALGVALGSAILAVGMAAWNDRAHDARRDERLHHVEVGFAEFRKPGKRFTQRDADRDRALTRLQLGDVKANLRELQALTHGNYEHWVDCKVKVHEVQTEVKQLQRAVFPNRHGSPSK